MKTATLILSLVLFTFSAMSVAQVNLSSDSKDYSDADSFMKMCTEYNIDRADRDQVCEQVWMSLHK